MLNEIILFAIKLYGVSKILDDYGKFLLDRPDILEDIAVKYPKERDKIELWKKLHGIQDPQKTIPTTFTLTPSHTSVLSISSPAPRSRLIIEENVLTIENQRPIPNRWKRFWYKLLLGWKWKDLTK